MPPLISTLASISVRGSRPISTASINPTILTPWVARIGRFSGNSFEISSGIVVAPNGDFYISGRNKATYSGSYINFSLTKFSSTGQIIWQTILGEFVGSTVQDITGLCVDSENNLYFVAAGYLRGINTGIDGYFGKLNSTNGSTVFIKRIYFNWYTVLTSQDDLYGIAYSSTDNTIVVTGRTGYIDGIPQGYSSKCLIAKYTLTGEIVWQRINRYTTTASDDGTLLYGKDVSIDSSGNIYVAASNSYVTDFTTGNTLLSLSSNGTRRWVVREKITGIEPNNLIPRKIITTSNNNTVIVALGQARISGTTSTYIKMATITQYNSSGTKLWQIQPNLSYGGTSPGTVLYAGLTSDSSNNIYVALPGISDSSFKVGSTYPYGNDCILLYKINGATGSILWIRDIKLNAAASSAGSGYIDNPVTIPTGLKCLGNFLYLVGYTNATLSNVRDTYNGVFLKIPTDGSLLSTTGFKINSEMGYKIIDGTALHTLFKYTSTTQTVTSSISDDVYSYTNNLSVDVSLTTTDNNMVKQIAVL
jgi:hypothetical protein